MIKPIGGYFEWEFPNTNYPFPHEKEGVLLNNARSALQLIMQSIDGVKKVFLPYYTCDSVTIALDAIGVAYQQYHIDGNLHIAEDIRLADGEYIIYTNYFGIMDAYCKDLAEVYGNRLIVDNAQTFYAAHIEGTHSAYSCRKYIGVPDGGIAVSNAISSIEHLPISRAYDRCGALLARAENDIPTGYTIFKDNDHRFREDGIARMSIISQKILRSIDHEDIVARRRSNFEYLHNALKIINQFEIPNTSTFACPLVYPFMAHTADLRKKLIENKIFVAQYWPNVLDWCNENTIEHKLTTHIMALPIDQRYGVEDMNRIISVINDYYGK